MTKKNDALEVRFTIRGNSTSPTGNPMPKLKMTGKQHWTTRAQLYVAWKNHVVKQLLDNARGMKSYPLIVRNIGIKGKAFETSETMKGHMKLTIRWANKAHGDPENIFGSIADALFVQDKFLDGSFESEVSRDGRGEVDVVITLTEKL